MFIDTNVLVNARIPGAPDHDAARAGLERAFGDPDPLRISRQIIREYLAVVTRQQPWPVNISREDALADMDRLLGSFEVLEDGPVVTESLVSLCREVPVGGQQIHDANIVATMLAHGEHRLLTFNGADFRRYGDRIELVGLNLRHEKGHVPDAMSTHSVFPLRLEKTYYNNGFFNVKRAFDHLVRSDDGPVTLQLGSDGSIPGHVNRTANMNGTARVMGGARLGDWFRQNYAMGDIVPITFHAPDRLILAAKN